MPIINEEGEIIEHHGVLGMKWGVRRDRQSSGGGRSAGGVAKGVAKAALIGDSSKSLVTKEGRANFKKTIGSIRKSNAYKEAKLLAIIDDQASLLTKGGRENFKGDIAKGKAKLNSLLSNKTFKALVYNHEGSKSMISSGKAKVDSVKAKLAADKAKRKKARVEATKKLIDDLIAGDQKHESSALFGNKFSEKEARQYWEKLFEKDLQE